MSIVVIVGLIVSAAVLTLGAPLILSSGRWTVRYPRMALLAWYSTFALGLTALLASLFVSVVAAITATSTGPAPWFESAVVVIAGWVGLAVAGGLGALIVSRAEPLGSAERKLQVQFELMSAASQRQSLRGIEVVFVDSAVPLAMSLGGSERRIVVTSCLVDALTSAQLRAVIEHERTHLIQHHGLIGQLAQLNRMCVPVLPAARGLERNTQLLIELIADDEAARRVGAVNAANALQRVGELNGDGGMILRARRLAEQPPRGSRTASRRVRRTLAELSG